MLRVIGTKDLEISSVTIPGWNPGYNIGDLLWAPIFKGVDPTDRRFAMWGKKRRLVATHLPNSIVARYCRLHKPGDKCPNGDYLRQSVAGYGKTVTNMDILAAAKELCKPTTLCVHMRLGDMRGARNQVFKGLKKVLDRFESIVVITGLHSHHTLYEKSLQQKMLLDSRTYLNKLLSLSKKVKVQLKGSADDHLYLASQSSNLLLSIGGYSYFAGICTKGSIFVPPSFQVSEKWVSELHKDATVEYLYDSFRVFERLSYIQKMRSLLRRIY